MALIEDSANRQIARSAGKVMIALLLSNLTNLVSLILNATTFGTHAEMDAFLAANRVSETLFVLMAGGALGSAFIPTFTGLLTKGERKPGLETGFSDRQPGAGCPDPGSHPGCHLCPAIGSLCAGTWLC